MKKFSLSVLMVGLLLVLATVDFNGTRVSANNTVQNETKRWVVIFHQPSSIPAGGRESVAAAGGTVTAELPEIGVLAATSSNPDFATEIAKNQKVDEVTEDIEMQFIPTAEQMHAQAVDPAANVEARDRTRRVLRKKSVRPGLGERLVRKLLRNSL